MNSELLGLFAKYMEKQEVLSKLTESEELHGYNYSEIHTIAAIGDMEFPNVTGISQAMHMTRGAISKITRTSSGLPRRPASRRRPPLNQTDTAAIPR